MFGRTPIDGRTEQTFVKTNIMNKLQRRPPRTDVTTVPTYTTTRAPRPHQAGVWTGCFNMIVSPAVDSYWADCLRYTCSIQRRSQFRTSHANCKKSGSVAVVVTQNHLPRIVSSARPGHKPRALLSFIRWEQRHRDLRMLLAQAMHANRHFSEGYILNAIEADASEEMGEPLLWFPVAHLTKDIQLGLQQKEGGRRQDRKDLGANFTLLQDVYYEHSKLTLLLESGVGGRGSPQRGPVSASWRVRHLLVLAYQALEDSTDPQLLDDWVRWSGAWEAYTRLQEKRLPVATITLYVRESSTSTKAPKVPKETFKYVVLLEVLTSSPGEQQQLRAATQRLRVERWSGYTGVYTLHTLHDFTDTVASSDRLTSDRLSTDRVTCDRVSSDRANSDRIANDRVVSDRVASDRVASDRVMRIIGDIM
ncbi:uncharacterized protein [Cherax quadricarinatus]|uniref:uncharacterized protein n=1 Tax=Cherax quadricarinatus TaxID=27406 RepID=UPI00387E704D